MKSETHNTINFIIFSYVHHDFSMYVQKVICTLYKAKYIARIIQHKMSFDIGADYMSRVVPACRVDSAKRVDYEIAITCLGKPG